jgi:hypothetical protein
MLSYVIWCLMIKVGIMIFLLELRKGGEDAGSSLPKFVTREVSLTTTFRRILQTFKIFICQSTVHCSSLELDQRSSLEFTLYPHK